MATDTKERPIVLREWEVRAIRAGRLTLLVRPVEPQPKHRLIEGLGHVTIGMDPADDGAAWYDANCVDPGREVRCPFGGPDDRLIGLEDWASHQRGDGYITYRADGSTWAKAPCGGMNPVPTFGGYEVQPWQDAATIPHWAARIRLVVEGVRVGRVQEIAEEDAKACGCDGDCPVGYVPAYQAGPLRYHHAWLYQQDHGDGAWDRNDWVWLISVRAAEGGAA